MGEKKEMLKCETCGSLIDPETGETHYQKGSNSETYNHMKQTIADLQHAADRLKIENDELKAQMKGEFTTDGTDSDSDDGKSKSFWKGFFKGNGDKE